jgi:hypothetical protein
VTARIGVSGHTDLTAPTALLVAGGIRAVLARHAADGLVGVTCLARGADQIFARVVLELGGAIEVAVPARDYRARKIEPDNAAEFDELLGRAVAVRTMPFDRSDRAAYMAASEHVLDTVDALVAVWDGRPARDYGGTADVVAAARERGLPVTVVWPDGAERGR